MGTGNFGIEYSESTLIQGLLNRRDKKLASKYNFVQSSYWGKTIGEILKEQKFERLVKVKATDGDSESFPVGAYSQFYTIYKDEDFLSIPGLKQKSGTSSGGVINVDDAFMEKWCNNQWNSRDLTYIYKTAKWCTKRKSITVAAVSKNGSALSKKKEYPGEFTKKDYEDLLRERSVSKEEKLWLKTLTNVMDSSKGNEVGKIVEWCACITDFVFVDEQDTDEYKRALKYCVKRSHQGEVKAITS